MKTKFFMLLAAMLLGCVSAFAQSGNNESLKGDLNEDGIVDVGDINAILKIMKDGGGPVTVDSYFYLGTTKPTAANYKSVPGIVAAFTSIDDAVGTTAPVAAGETLYMLCPAAWVTGKNVALEDNSGNTIDFLDEKDAATISGYVIYKTQVWNAPNDVVLKTVARYNLCTEPLTDYLKNRYDNGDYSYTNIGYAGHHSVYEHPVPVTIQTSVVDGVSSRKIILSDNGVLLRAKEITLDLVSTEYKLKNIIPNTVYYYKVFNDDVVTDSGKFTTDGGTVRWLDIANNSQSFIGNVRDIGGWNTDSGTCIHYGKIIRGEELNSGTTVLISQEGIDELKSLGVSAELDLRSSYLEQSVLGNDVEYYCAPVDLLFYRLNTYRIGNQLTIALRNFANAIRKTISWLRNGKGIYVHCKGGCDRTGALIAFIEGICGVSESDINHDYEISNRDRRREYYLRYKGDSYDGDFKFAMEFIKGLFKYQDDVYTWCHNYKYSKIIIDDHIFTRDNTITDNDVKYCVWTDGSSTYYTTDIYPDSNSIIYDSSFVKVGKTITATSYYFFFKVTGEGASSVAITDTELIESLSAAYKPTLKEQFRILLSIGGLTSAEMYELEMLLTS